MFSQSKDAYRATYLNLTELTHLSF